MSGTMTTPRIIFPVDYDTQGEAEAASRGYLSGVIVTLEDGSTYTLYFIDPVRLEQNLADDVREARCYYAEPGLVVLPEVTTEAVKRAVLGLWKDGYFRHLKPM